MSGMNVVGKGQRAPKQKVYTVDTRKPRANVELSVFLNPANGFAEILPSSAPRRPPIYRYFRFLPDLIGGVPKAQLEAAFQAAAVPPPPLVEPAGGAGAAAAPAPPLPNAPAGSQGSYGAMHEDDSIDDLANTLAEQGVASQGEFDELAALMEQKAQIGGARRRRRSTRKSRKSRRKYSRRRR
jgi:hypothetical protein